MRYDVRNFTITATPRKLCYAWLSCGGKLADFVQTIRTKWLILVVFIFLNSLSAFPRSPQASNKKGK
jgi:hypothetical protein